MRRTPTVTAAAQGDEPVRFAAEELARYLERMTGAGVERRSAEMPANTVVLGTTLADAPSPDGKDGFVVQPTADGAVIRGASARAALHGVYGLLEQLGCRWSLHGRADEVVPQRSDLPPIVPLHVAPRFDVRGYSADIMTWHYGDAAQLAEHLAADVEFVDWMGKTAANAYLFIRHPFDSQLTIPELLPEFARRGIDAEYGGHVVPSLLPRELFAQHPEFFPQSRQGARSEFGNLCTADPGAMRVAADNAVRYVRDYPELHTLHIWGADLWHGGWCHCVACAGVSVQDQSLRLCNAVAEGLAAHGLARPVCYLAYHDTIEPDLRERPADQVYVEFAPRERCYGHTLDDVNCRTNRPYREALERYVELFDGRVRIFEYYADAILFCGCAVPLAQVIAGDLDYYHRLGIGEITNLQFGGFSTWAYDLNFLVYAAATRAAACDVDSARDAYGHTFGVDAGRMHSAISELEAVMRTVVTYGDIRRPPKEPEAIGELRPRLDAAIARLGTLVDQLARPSADAPVRAFADLVRYTAAVLAGVQRQIAGGAAAADYDAALAIMSGIDRRFIGLWGAVNLPVIHAYYAGALQPS